MAMSYKMIVSDWNGTLFQYPTDEVQNKAIGYAVLADAKEAVKRGQFWRIGDVFNTKANISKKKSSNECKVRS